VQCCGTVWLYTYVIKSRQGRRNVTIPLAAAKDLTHGTIIYYKHGRNADGTPARFKINGRVKRWKRTPDRVEIPIKRGLWEYAYLENGNLCEFALREDDARE
jgi:hypothetical protein